MAQMNFDARTVQPDTGMEPVPTAWYNVMADASEKKPTNDGQGEYLEVRYNILDGQYRGRKLFSRFNTKNNNAQAMDIAYRQLSALCHATGVLVLQDSQQLHGIPLKIRAILKEARTDKDTGKHYEASNDVRGWKNINEPVDGPEAGPQAQAAPQPAPQAPQGWGAPVPAPQPAPQQAAQPWQQQQPQPGQPPVQGAPAASWQPPAPAPAPAAQPPAAAPWQQQQPPAGGTQAAAPWQAQQPAQQQQPPATAQPWQQQQPPAQPAQQTAPWAGQGGAAQATPPWQQQR